MGDLSHKKNSSVVKLTDDNETDCAEIGTKTGGEKALHVIAEANISAGSSFITEEHKRIHDGDSYYIHGRALLGNGGTKLWAFKTATKEMHFIVDVFAEKETDIVLDENIAVIGEANPDTVLNRNRSSSNTPDATFYTSFAITPSTTVRLIDTFITGGSTGQGNNPSMGDRSNNELVLKPNTWYYLQLTSRLNSNNIAWIVDWYEV